MKNLKLTDENRLTILELWQAGKITLMGTELDLTAVSTNEPRRECLEPQKVMRLVRAKQIILLNGVKL